MKPIELKAIWIGCVAFTAGRATIFAIIGSFMIAGWGAFLVLLISGDQHVIDTIWTLQFVVTFLSALIGTYSFVFFSLKAAIEWMIFGGPRSLKELGFDVPEVTRDLFNYEQLLFDCDKLVINHEDTGWFPISEERTV